MHMTYSSDQNSERMGATHRNNPDRYFHVMTQGWYVFTREGIRGPFADRDRAERFVQGLINDDNGDPSASWRLDH